MFFPKKTMIKQTCYSMSFGEWDSLRPQLYGRDYRFTREGSEFSGIVIDANGLTVADLRYTEKQGRRFVDLLTTNKALEQFIEEFAGRLTAQQERSSITGPRMKS